MRLASSLALLFLPAAAFAGDALKVEVVPKAMVGQGSPALIVKAEVALQKLTLDVERSTDKKRMKLAAGPVHAGRDHRFELSLSKPGRARFAGTLSVELPDGTGGQMPIAVDVELLEPLKVQIAREDVDLEKKQLVLRADRDVARAQVSVMSDTGTPLGTTEESFGGRLQPAGRPVSVSWKQATGTVLRITVQAWDPDGFFGAVDLFPWHVDIPHEEVNFATGSYEITKAEAPKLEASYEELTKAIDRYGELAKVRLFIAGHTDTVGDAASNRVLSNNRAQAISRWFSSRGVSIPVLYAGFGEDLLLVKTPDDTDELRNRRAEYIVAVDPPPLAGARWTSSSR